MRLFFSPEGMHSIFQTILEQHGFDELGPAPLNAIAATDRAMLLAAQYGISCIKLTNSNHWMRGGYCGYQAARKGFVLIA